MSGCGGLVSSYDLAQHNNTTLCTQVTSSTTPGIMQHCWHCLELRRAVVHLYGVIVTTPHLLLC